MTAIEGQREQVSNGAALAAFLGAGIGALALGLLVILNEAGVFRAPALYGPAGGVSGRTTFAAVIWLLAWFVLHKRWKLREIESRGVHTVTFILIALGLLLTFPPVWKLVA
jgi:multisubunit Na+/H+ antiporter MnhG subunit